MFLSLLLWRFVCPLVGIELGGQVQFPISTRPGLRSSRRYIQLKRYLHGRTSAACDGPHHFVLVLLFSACLRAMAWTAPKDWALEADSMDFMARS